MKKKSIKKGIKERSNGVGERETSGERELLNFFISSLRLFLRSTKIGL